MSRRHALLVLLAALPASAQTPPPDDYSGLEEMFRVPRNSFSVGVRYSGKTSARFSHLGTIPSTRIPGLGTVEESRTYDDGSVSLDARTTTSGVDLPDD